jgi:adenosine deaminase
MREDRIDRELLRRLPKAELHCHLDGSLRPQTMLDLARLQWLTMRAHYADALREYMIVSDALNL